MKVYISAWDYDSIGRNDMIGGVVLTSQPHPAMSALAMKHWQEMFETQRPVVNWHTLQEVALV